MPVAGESLDSWLEALARRHNSSPGQLLTVLGRQNNRRIRRLLHPADPYLLRRLENAAGLGIGQLNTAVWGGGSDNPERSVGTGSRFCPKCLAESGGRWQLQWRLDTTIACHDHRILLGDCCPDCQTIPRRHLPGGPWVIPAATCTRPIGKSSRRRCGADLTTLTTAAAPAEMLAAQSWVDTLAATAASGAVEASHAVTDLGFVTAWMLRIAPEQALETARAMNPNRRAAEPHGDLAAAPDAALTAAALIHAQIVLGDEQAAAITHLRDTLANQTDPQRVPPPRTDPRQWAEISGRFSSRYLRAIDTELITSDRLRMKTPTPAAARPNADTVARAKMIPQRLWPDWTARLLPAGGFHPGLFRASLAALLLVPGARQRDMRAAAVLLNPRVKRANMTTTLQGFDRLATGSAVDEVLILLCRLADHLDQHRSPIDYQRRRELLRAEVIDWPTWRDLACSVDAHPGDNRRGRRNRLLLANRHLHHLITGSDLENPKHPLAFHNPNDRSQFVAFTTTMSAALRRALHEYAEAVLTDHGIDEPLLWSPPHHLADGLTLPGVDIDSLDIDKISRLVIDEQRPPTEVADLLDVHVEHIRLALERLDRPARQWSDRATPAFWQREQRAATLFTREYFEREYLTKRRSLKELAAETGFGRHIISRYAKQAGIQLRRSRDPLQVDSDWLRTQYLDKKRSTSDIAAELGVSQMTVNHALPRLGIPVRAQGVHSRTEMIASLDPTIPTTIRTAVESTLHGWQRLHRFRIAMAFPTLNTASEYLAMPSGSLFTQINQLEKALGANLFHRATYRKPQQPTELGHQLLRDLQHPEVQQLMTTALNRQTKRSPDKNTADTTNQPPPARKRRPQPMPDAASIAQAREKLSKPRKHTGLQPFPDIPVTRLRMTRVALTVLADLRTHYPEQFFGQQ
ncbi:TniQ family protein, partial [Nocardia vinacea]